MSEPTVNVVRIDAAGPLDAGQQLMQAAVLPMLRAMAGDCDPADRARLYSGAMASLAGDMAGAVGVAQARVALSAVVLMLDKLAAEQPSPSMVH